MSTPEREFRFSIGEKLAVSGQLTLVKGWWHAEIIPHDGAEPIVGIALDQASACCIAIKQWYGVHEEKPT